MTIVGHDEFEVVPKSNVVRNFGSLLSLLTPHPDQRTKIRISILNGYSYHYSQLFTVTIRLISKRAVGASAFKCLMAFKMFLVQNYSLGAFFQTNGLLPRLFPEATSNRILKISFLNICWRTLGCSLHLSFRLIHPRTFTMEMQNKRQPKLVMEVRASDFHKTGADSQFIILKVRRKTFAVIDVPCFAFCQDPVFTPNPPCLLTNVVHV